MKFYKLTGGTTNKDISKYIINWKKKSRSKYQENVKYSLRPFWKNHIVYEEFPVVGTKMTLDIVNLTKRVALEIQGEQHTQHNKFFHGDSKIPFWDQLDRDSKKKEWCDLNKLRLVEIFPYNIPLTQQTLTELDLI